MTITRRQARRRALGLPEIPRSRKSIEHLRHNSAMTPSESSFKPRRSVPDHWLLETKEFKSWERFLWIKGKPGAGKSTLMEHIARFTAYQMRDQATVTFCSVASTRLYPCKSLAEIYGVMLYQILSRNPELDTSLKKIYGKGYLKSCLETAITNMSRPLICFIDALDSCLSDELSQLLNFCRKISSSSSVKFCFSSRHYPYIDVCGDPTVVLEEQQGHYGEIQSYLKENLESDHLVPDMRDSLVDEILQKSSGCFLWIESLIVHDVQIALLDEVLPEMKQCLDNIVSVRGVEGTYLDLLLCVQCVMHAKRPLSMEELFFAVLSGLPDRPNKPSTWTKLEVEKFVVTNSRGLVEVDKSSGSIRFIHQTVPEILRQLFEENGITYDYMEAQEYMRQSCKNYLSRPTSLTPYIKSSTLVELIQVKFPFLRYALESHGHHSQAATSVKNQGHSTCDKMTDGQLLVAWYQTRKSTSILIKDD